MRGLHAIFTNMFAGQGLVRAATAAAATGTVVPTAPGPGDVFKQGGDCTFSWTPDPSGTWKQTDVELMTGDNFNMVFITSAFSSLRARDGVGDADGDAGAAAITSFDGTDASKTTFSYPCPEVTPNSAIYFYQFSSPAVPDRQWTTRFTIADASGASTPPTNATQPGAPPGSTPIPWGTGALVDPSKVVAAPSYLGIPSAPGASGSGTASVSASATASASSASASGSSASSAASVTVTASVGSSSGAGAGSTTEGTTSAVAVTQTSTVSTAPAAPTSSSAAGNGTSGSGQNGAVGVHARLGPAVLALCLAAVGFAVAF
ncbi:hypothetical protein TRAPUB_6067 [Trametes pubescens]|uniref:Uncharacterized protein n=1 Tax=Trametes pubescens TaxID=154538 RepID=A0A1M2V6Q6_TRAPU|nr:hypothetical protein TRAPUB_6067 [Trametes pubescens]